MVAVVALIGALIAAYMLLYKLGFIGSVLCGTGGCEVVQNSPWAVFLGIPVAAWGLAGYIAILAVALVGADPRFEAQPWIAIALLGLTAAGFAFSLYLTYLEAFVIHAWCQWCVASAILAALALGFALPEIRRVRDGGELG